MNRQIIIGDIHGCYSELLRLLDKISPSESDTVVALGDIIDRGPDSVRVFNLFRNTQNFESIIGNHERKHITGYYSYAQEISKIQFGTEYPEAINWLEKMPYYREYESAIVVHAAIEPGIPMQKQREDVLCGSSSGEKYLQKKFNGRPWYELYEGSKPIIFGHAVFEGAPLIYKDMVYGMDTGACHGGHLSAITLPDFKIYSVQSKDNYWLMQKKAWQSKVLSSKPWTRMNWAQIDREINKIEYLVREKNSTELNKFIEWRQLTDQIFNELMKALQTKVIEIVGQAGADGFAKTAKNHPYSQLLFLSRSGNLTIERIKKKYPNLKSLLRLAHQMKVDVSEIESFSLE
jgi:serine/threonine protein phosphatase 1